MRKLQVEELEPRQLLNGSGFSYQPLALQPSPTGTVFARVAERAPFVDYGGVRAGPGGLDVEVLPPRMMALDSYAGKDPQVPVPHLPAPENQGSTRPETRGPGVPGVGAALPSDDSVTARALEAVRAEAVAILSPPGPADGSREANAAAVEAALGVSSQRPNPLSPAPFENMVVTVGFHIDPQALSAVRPPVWVLRERPGVSVTADPTTAARNEEQSEEGPVLPAPQVSGVLAALPPSDLSALELGMRQFLDQLGKAGQRLTSYSDGIGLYLWIVATATAAGACEIARRQLARNQESGVNDWAVVP
jgi:hypothetical protein